MSSIELLLREDSLSALIWCNVLPHQVRSTILHYSAPLGLGLNSLFGNQQLKEGLGYFCSQMQFLDIWQARCDLETLCLCAL